MLVFTEEICFEYFETFPNFLLPILIRSDIFSVHKVRYLKKKKNPTMSMCYLNPWACKRLYPTHDITEWASHEYSLGHIAPLILHSFSLLNVVIW